MHKGLTSEPLLPGIPNAPTGKRYITAAEIDFQKRKRILATRLPVLKPEDLVGTLEQPFYQILLRDLMASGNSMVADEINNLLRKEERDQKSGRLRTKMSPVRLMDQPDVLQRIADTLKLEQTLLNEGKRESAMLMCKQLADSFLLQDRSVWLARHFYLAVLNRCRKICPTTTNRLQAEIHCLLAYIARENNESLESALAIAIDHLAVCRTLSRDQSWQFKANTILIKLKRPIAFYGITSEDVYELVDGSTMSLYMIASLLEHELLISLANQIMHSPHHKGPNEDDLKNAHEFADLALKLALEVRQPVAMSSALTRFGLVLRHCGAYEDAMKYFQQLQQHASLTADIATEAIAYHNMGLCFIGMTNAVDALECFARQKELASVVVLRELEGNSMHEIGHLLLQEGHLWEAEESYAIAYDSLMYAQRHRPQSMLNPSTTEASHPHHHHHHNHESVNRCDLVWGMLGVTAGQKLWSRLAGLCRSERAPDLRSVLQFKCGRKLMNPVDRPNYTMISISEMDRPWDSSQSDYSNYVDEFQTETTWDARFMFAGPNRQNIRRQKKPKKVGFDAEVVNYTFSVDDGIDDIISPISSKRTMDEARKGYPGHTNKPTDELRASIGNKDNAPKGRIDSFDNEEDVENEEENEMEEEEDEEEMEPDEMYEHGASFEADVEEL